VKLYRPLDGRLRVPWLVGIYVLIRAKAPVSRSGVAGVPTPPTYAFQFLHRHGVQGLWLIAIQARVIRSGVADSNRWQCEFFTPAIPACPVHPSPKVEPRLAGPLRWPS
jgi:hypothetical protein